VETLPPPRFENPSHGKEKRMRKRRPRGTKEGER
jgi:hypothetical protein